MDRIDQLLAEMKSVNKSVTAIEKSHAVLVGTNNLEHKSLNEKMKDLVDQKKVQNGRVLQAEVDIKQNSIGIAGIKGGARTWAVGISLIITTFGIVAGFVFA